MTIDPDLFADLSEDALYRALSTRDARFDGRLFVGVKTTGIYCRPICPARTPKRENVRFYASAAAAQEAGFRPCLRCRPETAPQSGAWRGVDSVVSRALSLIEAGALDEGDVETLAERLGLGGRQLRRLFKQRLGASPVAVAQTRRIHLAKQLIHETSLPMAQVALAAGFGSIRRFNETFQRLFDRPPAQLRRLSSAAAAGPGVVLHLAYRPPYDWDAIIAFLSARAIPGAECVSRGAYARSIAVGGAQGALRVTPAKGNRLKVEVRFPHVAALPVIIAGVRRVFDLGADPAAVAAHLGQDAHLAPLVAARPGLRVPGGWDGFELAVRAILGQQITVTAAVALAGKLTAAYGAPLETPAFGLTHVFPAAETLASADLSTLGMPGARIRALSGLAAAAAADPAMFTASRSLEAAIESLRALPGIGDWTAQYIAMRQLREPDAFPAADIGLMRALTDADGRRPNAAELLARAEAWRPWRAYATMHLWAADADLAAARERPAERRRAA